ncbi:sulfatase [Lentisphaera marina]|uniref:sulfatase n=1 Tax=Lentisphaera marina TaxID=1111041 RepID=UPI0023659ED2|nr:sulfatase [Lentisphaera marina]MDD7984764.1 sulfatase [Lentisphaera marina]
MKYLLCLGLLISITTFAKEKMNVLFISADDLNCDIGPYGNKQVKTPNLDRLAKMGTVFDRAYCQQPLCGPSRASIMSGLRPNNLGVFTLNDKLRGRIPNLVTMGEFFQSQDYYSGRVGKIYHYGNPTYIGTNGHDDEQTWTERFNPIGIDRTQEENIIRYPGGITGKKGRLGISMAWWDPVSEDNEHTDGLVADRAIKMIEANKNKAFFIAAGFFNPHCPYVAPKKYFDMYDIKDIKLQDLDEAKKELEDVPALAISRDGGQRWPYFYKGLSRDEAKQCKLAYYATVSFIDAQIGRILDSLEEHNLMDKTIIVFWSDHGYFLGEKGLWFKRKAFERSARAPLIIASPSSKQGQICKSPVEMLDIYPTLVEETGFQIPKELEGLSLSPLLKNAQTQWSKAAITQIHHASDKQGYSIRTKKWRYTEWNEGRDGKELYDHENDPEERVNLASSPEYTQIMTRLSQEVQNYSKTYVANSKKVKNNKKK